MRWLALLGAPRADLEDLAQEVFVVASRRLNDFDGGNTAGWLYRIASGQVRQNRRRAWVRMMSMRSESAVLDDLPYERPGAESEMETRQRRELLDRLLSRMTEKRRMVFLLFEMRGYAVQEIAGILHVPPNTIKTRLHHARKDFARVLAEHKGAAGAEI